MNHSALPRDYTNEMVGQPAAPTTDEQLLRQVARGDEEAFGELYQRHHVPLYNYLLRLIHEPGAAEDLLQEVFVATWQGASRFRGRAKVTTWLFRIAHHQAVSWLRRHRQVWTLDDATEPATDDDLEEQVVATWRADQLHQALDQLSPKHRAVLELAFFGDLSYSEIAEIVDCPVGTVKSRMSYARRYLNGALWKLGIGECQK